MPKVTVERRPLTWQEMTRQAMAEEARKQPPMGWEVPSDQLYAPSSDVPITTGFAPGGAEEPIINPEDIATAVPWKALAGLAGKGMLAATKAGAIPLAVGMIKRTPSLNSIHKINAAKEALAEIADTSGLSTYEGAFKEFANKTFDPADLISYIDTMPEKELVKGIEESYAGGMEQFLKDYRKNYAPQAYSNYARMFHSAKTVKDKEKIKSLMDSIKAEGIHTD